MRGVTTSESKKPAQLPVDLRDARLKLAEAIQLLGFSLLALALAVVGVSVALAVTPQPPAAWSGFRFWFFLFGSGIGSLCVYVAWQVVRLMIASWQDYREWCWMYVEVDIQGRQVTHNTEQETTVTAWELSTSTPRDVLLVALAVHYAVKAGNTAAHTVRGLQGDKWLGGIRLGDVNTTQAQRMSKALAQLGLVSGKGEKKAGEWVPESTEEVLQLVDGNWSRVHL